MIRTQLLGACACAALAGCYSGVDVFEDGLGPALADGGEGDDGDGGDDGGDSGDPAGLECETDRTGHSPLRRLTSAQYDNTIGDLLGIETDVTSGFAPDEKIGAFYSNGVAPITDLGVEKYMDAAEGLATEAVADLSTIMACDPAADGASECADTFIDDFGRRAFRRPLTAAEHAQMRSIYDSGAADGFANGIRLTLVGFLQSPYFLYHVELGDPATDDGTYRALTGYEVASRLSYFMWGTTPDPELLDAAEAGVLDTATGVRAQAQRLLDDPRSRDGIASFHEQWLGIDKVSDLEKDATLFPGFDDSLKEAMLAEAGDFADHVIREGDGTLTTLLTAPYSVIDAQLATLYGVTLPAGHVPGDVVQLDASERAGLITQAGLLAVNAHVNQSSPVHRGVLIRQNFLCQTLPPPPEDVDNVPPDPDPNATTRERMAEHTANPSCAGCHVLIDGIGFGFENYDAIGSFRTMEGALSVDASGEVIGTEDIDGEFDGAVQLAQKLADSSEVEACVAQQWFNFALGRVQSDNDTCSTDLLLTGFVESGGNVRELMLSLAETDAFRMRRVTEEGQ
jgi:hypothetical protein